MQGTRPIGPALSEIIPVSMQLAAGRTAQEFDQRKNRKGASREDRYHGAAVETNYEIRWTKSVAAGDRDFEETIKAKPGIRARWR